MSKSRSALVLILLLATTGLLNAADVPLDLPMPDGKPGDSTKPVQVYILAGQSNMVGMGDLTGARPLYPSVFLSADPNVIAGRMPVGGSALGRHGIYQSADANAASGATVRIYRGEFDPTADDTLPTPIKTTTVALGTVAAELPKVDFPHTVVAEAFIDVPATGRYQVHVGFGNSSYAVVLLAGKPVYRRDLGENAELQTVFLQQGKRYPISVRYRKGGSAAFWMEQVEIEGKGDLETVVKKDRKFPYLIDDSGNWTVRQDVCFQEARIAPDGKGGLLTATSNGRSIGPELGFGFVTGTFHDEQVLLIKTAMGNRALGWDFRPPSSGRTNGEDADKWEGLEYRLMIEGVRKTLNNLANVIPGYQGQGYELAGFGWFQGHKDGGIQGMGAEYEQNLVNLINDVRKEFDAPKMAAVIATVGFEGWNMGENYLPILKAQMAVSDAQKYPEFAGNVASVDTRDFWREINQSPVSQNYHYHRNAETYMLIGEAMGRAMVRLRGGTADAIPTMTRTPDSRSELSQAVSETLDPTEQQLAASIAATAPMVLEGALQSFLADPRNQQSLTTLVQGEKPPRSNQFLRDTLDGVVSYYRAVGITDYDWKPFGPVMQNASWDYFTFDPAEETDKAKGARYRNVTYPEGMEDWFAGNFDPLQANWKTAAAPFGQLDGQLVPLNAQCGSSFCGCGSAPNTLWNREVLLMRQAFKIPRLKPGHRYRVVVGGSCHVNAGEGFALYIDGKQMAESKDGVYRRQGGQPRGSHIYKEFIPALEDGNVLIAVKSFLRYNHPRTEVYPRGHISVWMEEMKIPPIQQP
ncbi:MAG: sialate O-acetylesterase [Rubripirellula sp.]|nr:sialate O-acetylesterase [Rubripirellula sp.]